MVTRRKLAAWMLCVTALAATQGSARAESITLNEALARARPAPGSWLASPVPF